MSRMIGINRAGSIWVTPEDVALLARGGLRYRVDFRREHGEGARDACHKLLTEAGVGYLPILTWDLDRPTTTGDWQLWKNYVQTTVARYPAQTHWQVWNEPNNARVPATLFETVDAWRGFMRRSARYIKAANPGALVIAGGIAVGGHGSKRIIDPCSPWFRVNDVVDRVAVHTYCSDPFEAALAINGARAAAAQPVWCTELGRKSTVDGERQQAAWYRQVRDRTPGVPLFWFDLQDVDGAFDGFGAIRRDRTRKPVWRSLVA